MQRISNGKQQRSGESVDNHNKINEANAPNVNKIHTVYCKI